MMVTDLTASEDELAVLFRAPARRVKDATTDIRSDEFTIHVALAALSPDSYATAGIEARDRAGFTNVTELVMLGSLKAAAPSDAPLLVSVEDLSAEWIAPSFLSVGSPEPWTDPLATWIAHSLLSAWNPEPWSDAAAWVAPLLLSAGGPVPSSDPLVNLGSVASLHGGSASRQADGVVSLPSSFWSRLLRFVAWSPGWDGEEADHIAEATATRAGQIAEGVASVAGVVPLVAPASDGSLLLEWSLPNGISVELFVTEEGWEPVVTSDPEGVEEHEIGSIDDLKNILRQASRGEV